MKNRFVLGLLILVVAGGAIAIAPDACKYLGLCSKPPTPLYGEIGGSKEGLFLDQDVRRILRDKYGLDVRYNKLGGEDQVCGSPSNGLMRDFIWPGTEIAVERYKACHGGKAGQNVEYALISPIVFYSWAPVTDALIKQGWLEQTDGIYYLDLPRFTPVLIQGRPFKDIGLNLFGNINVVSTDPANSNSGQVWAALLATMLNNGQVPDENSIEQLLRDVKKYFDRQGILPQKSSDLFDRFTSVGMGDKPIIVGYESLLPDYIYQNRKACSDVAPVRVIYPRPTVWASHPLIAETANGVKLQQALRDPEIQKLAWERHGFRAELGKVTSALAANCMKVPESIVSTIPLPQARVMDRLISFLKPGN